MKLTVNQYMSAQDNYEGYCTSCDLLTRDSTEPDAENYNCPECEEHTVMGVDNALMMGLIEIDDEADDE